MSVGQYDVVYLWVCQFNHERIFSVSFFFSLLGSNKSDSMGLHFHENYWLFPFYSNNLAFILHSFSYEYFTLGIYMCILSSSVGFDSLSPHGLYPTRLLCPWNFLGKNTGMGCYFFLQGIFPTQELNQCLLYQTRLSNWARP